MWDTKAESLIVLHSQVQISALRWLFDKRDSVDPISLECPKRAVAAQLKAFCLLIALLQLTACASAPANPALQDVDLPRLVPVRQFVANTDHNDNYQLSPNGEMLVYQGVSRLKPAILWRDLSKQDGVRALRFRKASPYPFWSADSRYILYSDDPSGKEQSHVYAIDVTDPKSKPRDLTPHDGVTAYVNHVPGKSSNRIFVSHNRRDKSIFDIYEIDLDTGAESLVYENDDNVIDTLMDDEGHVVARVRQTNSNRMLEVLHNDQWDIVLTAGQFDWISPQGLNADASGLYVISNVERDKAALILIDLKSKQQTLVFEHPLVDVQYVYISRLHNQPLLAYVQPDYPDIKFFDTKLEEQLSPYFKPGENGIDIMSMDRLERMATLVVYDHTGATFLLVDLRTGESEVLGEAAVRKNADVWVNKTPFSITAQDGMKLHGYISKPELDAKKPLPTVLLVHGGPWARDGWGYNSDVQFLANRGYAVLQINYRGSSGYGKDYMFAAVDEFAAKMHTDLLDAVDWSIEQGITDPDQVAIMGGSYGGYATLVGMTMTPERFECGVDYVGVSDLSILLESAPPYWKPSLPFWRHFIGDANDPEQRKILDSKSPVNFADQALKPLLVMHGANDPRVVLEHSDRMVAALEEAGKPVEYIVIQDEGHGFNHWKHQMTRYRKTEDFLARCLGGRSGGLDFYQLGSWAF